MPGFLNIKGLSDFQISTHLTTILNNIGFNPTWILNSGLYTFQGIPTTSVSLDAITSSPKLLATRNRGDIGKDLVKSTKDAILFETIHHAEEISFTPDELQDKRKIGGMTLETLSDAVEREFGRVVRPSFSVTLEHHMYEGIFGIVVDKDGTVIHNLRDILRVSLPDARTLNLSEDNALRSVAREAKRAMNIALNKKGYVAGAGMPIVLCGEEFFGEIDSSKEVTDALKHASAQDLIGKNNALSSFVYNGTLFVDFPSYEIDGMRIGPKDDEAIMTTRNVAGLYKCFFAPATTLDAVNRQGLPLHVIQGTEAKYKDKLDFKIEMSPLCVSAAPEHVQTLKLGTTTTAV